MGDTESDTQSHEAAEAAELFVMGFALAKRYRVHLSPHAYDAIRRLSLSDLAYYTPQNGTLLKAFFVMRALGKAVRLTESRYSPLSNVARLWQQLILRDTRHYMTFMSDVGVDLHHHTEATAIEDAYDIDCEYVFYYSRCFGAAAELPRAELRYPPYVYEMEAER